MDPITEDKNFTTRLRNFGARVAKLINRGQDKESTGRKEPHAYYYSNGMNNIQVFGISYNGEKNLGEIGPIKQYQLEYEALRLRSWQAYLDSDVTQMVLRKFAMWIIGGGLKLQANPHKIVLEQEGIKFDLEDFNDIIEARFESFCKSKSADWSGEKTLRKMMSTAFLNSIIGGDVLVVLRYVDKKLTVQLIDGSHVWNPIMGNDYFAFRVPEGQPGAGNDIRNGVEYNDRGEVTAYYVRTANKAAGSSFYTGTYERIEAKSPSTGLTMAYLVTGLEYRIDNKRGIPLISAVMETIKKMERYKEATIATAEERAKFSYQVVQQAFSNDQNPFTPGLAKIRNADANIADDVPRDINGINLSPTAVATTNKTALFLPKGMEVKTLAQHGDGALIYKDFYNTNIDLVCATLQIPPEVAKSMYDSNYSASRAAIKDWQHTIMVTRNDFGFQFLQPIYELFLHIKILEKKMDAPGYIQAFYKKNTEVLDAYRHCHWIGSAVANIDPLKEVMAARLKLGVTGAGIPLTTVEKILEDLGEMSDVPAIMEQYAKELKLAKKKKIKIPKDQRTGGQATDENDEEEDDKKDADAAAATEKTDIHAIFKSVMQEVLEEMKTETNPA
jgi:capsid protein